MKFLNKILNINVPQIPTKEELEAQSVPLKLEENSVIATIGFLVHKDGNVSIKTDWISASPIIATIYAKLLYEINTGNLEESINNALMMYAGQHIQSQEFIEGIFNKYKELMEKYKKMPIIFPSQVLKGPNN